MKNKWIKGFQTVMHTWGFERMYSYHRLVTTKLRLSLRRNKKHTVKSTCTTDPYLPIGIIAINKIDTPQEILETHTFNDEYEKFIIIDIKAALYCKRNKSTVKWRIQCESLAIRKKRANMKIATLIQKMKSNEFRRVETWESSLSIN